MFKLPTYNTEGKKIEDIILDKRIFNGEVNRNAIYQAIICYQANRRAGRASCKTRKDVSGGGTKPWRQKGTGRSRVGSFRSPLFRHGGVVFGPKPKDFSYSLPQKIKLLALRSSLNAKLKQGDVILIDDIKLATYKTKEMIKVLAKLPNLINGVKLIHTTLGVLEAKPQVLRCMRNISNLAVMRPQNINTYDILRYKKILITKDALKKIVKRISN